MAVLWKQKFNVEEDMIIENEEDFLFGLEVLTAPYPQAEIVCWNRKAE